MNPPCAKCSKTVYPTEKLNCLDKTWHKLCFKCETCSMLLNMKNYKGYNKLPYCNTHYPTTKFTAVADTPENLRLKKQSQNQSQVTYHKEFNQSKGKFTAVADDPESMRLRKVSEQASNIAYKGQAAGGYQSDRPSYQPSEPQQAYQPPPPQESYQPPPPQSAPVAPPPATGPRYVAIYDYTAADSDEVSFVEGDVILDGEIIDAGWMTGTVARTGEHGMLPSNYVEQQ
ncbi:LIM and SH3 domain protein 1-like [Diadema setosum]|uniref:LIM and SH3 domain protein 1-like n=1 Tax=Diadema setosum TaxID=31175 RepID=UPI003B3B96A0